MGNDNTAELIVYLHCDDTTAELIVYLHGSGGVSLLGVKKHQTAT